MKATATARPQDHPRCSSGASHASLWRTQHRVDENLLRAKLTYTINLTNQVDKELKSESSRIENRFDTLMAFLDKHMVTREDFVARFETVPTRQDFNVLQRSVDGIAKSYKDTGQELLVVGERTSRMETWIIKAAAKIGLDYKP